MHRFRLNDGSDTSLIHQLFNYLLVFMPEDQQKQVLYLLRFLRILQSS